MNRFFMEFYRLLFLQTGTYSPSDAEEGRIISASTSTKQRELQHF